MPGGGADVTYYQDLVTRCYPALPSVGVDVAQGSSGLGGRQGSLARQGVARNLAREGRVVKALED